MGHPNEDFVRDGYAAFGRGDIQTLKDTFFAEDIRWHFPGKSQMAGDYQGVDDVLAWLGKTFELSGGTITIDLHDVIGNDEHVVSLSTVRAQREGQSYEDNTAQVFHIKDGKVTEVWANPGDIYATDAFWA
jgi:hypothetical protein